ncbi:MAG: iron-containing alcohol dehydrogenase, partial [Verrucomicrobia bacterium]|nr:iron-containing alcohol dehydrogenase [Verrucomicrobiota bacterium]
IQATENKIRNMKTLEVHVDLGSRSYPIFIGSGLLDLLGKYCRDHTKVGRCMLVGDSHTMPLFGKQCAASLKKASYPLTQWKFRAGEASKDLKTLGRLYDALAKEGMERSSFLAALGGGVVGDMVGFAAATYMRGIAFVQVPTTLLAQVDSSVGGKTAVNLTAGKNLVGAFYQPKCVLCDVDVLKTLPARQLRCGLSEVIKYGIILDADFFARLEKQVDSIMACDSKVMAQVVKR